MPPYGYLQDLSNGSMDMMDNPLSSSMILDRSTVNSPSSCGCSTDIHSECLSREDLLNGTPPTSLSRPPNAYPLPSPPGLFTEAKILPNLGAGFQTNGNYPSMNLTCDENLPPTVGDQMQMFLKLKWEKEQTEAKLDRLVKDAPWILDNKENGDWYPEQPQPWESEYKLFSSSDDEVIDL